MIDALLIALLQGARSAWAEAILAEARVVEPGWARTAWLWGGVKTMLREASMHELRLVRFAAIVPAGVVIALSATILLRYPRAAGGDGGILYSAILALLLAGYLAAAWLLTSGEALPGRVAALRRATVAGDAAAVVLAFGLNFSTATRVWYLAVAVTLPPLIAAFTVVRSTGRLETGILTGAWTGMTAAMANLMLGMVLILALPSRVPMDSDVLRHNNTAADILAANIGESLVGYILFLAAGPALGVLFGLLGTAMGYRWRSTQTGS
jgi:hypothetical protein